MLVISGILIALLFARFSEYGGRSQEELSTYKELQWLKLTTIRGRIWKRLIAPLTLTLGIVLISALTGHFSYWFLFSPLAYISTTSAFGYGPNDVIAKFFHYDGEELWKKILRRTVWSIARTISSLTFVLFTGKWGLFALQLIIGLFSAVYLGVKNPLKAPQEEGIINLSSVLFVPYMVL
jgi:hypothetical protein